jgi:dienelactone hydrolase
VHRHPLECIGGNWDYGHFLPGKGNAQSRRLHEAGRHEAGLAGRYQNATLRTCANALWEKPMKIARLTFLVLAAAAVLQAGAARAAMKTEWIDYKQGNTALSGYLVYDDAAPGRRPGVLMIPDRSGFSEGTIADAEMIAKLGYVVFAEDIFGKGVVPKTVPEMTELTTIYNNDRPLMRARALAGFDVLKAQPMVDPTKLAAVGYCFGGTVGIELIETGAPLLGFVSVHGSFRNFAPEAANNIKGRVLIARRRRPGRPDGGTQCRDLATPRRQGGFRGQPLQRHHARLHPSAEPLGGARRRAIQGGDDAFPEGIAAALNVTLHPRQWQGRGGVDAVLGGAAAVIYAFEMSPAAQKSALSACGSGTTS